MTRYEFNIINRLMNLRFDAINNDLGYEQQSKDTAWKLIEGILADLVLLLVKDDETDT